MASDSLLRKLPTVNFNDIRGNLDVMELYGDLGFEIKRIYVISNVPQGTTRGRHAHKELRQAFFSLSGSFEIEVTDGVSREKVELMEHGPGYVLQPGCWRELSSFSKNAICLVLASEQFNKNDYINSFEEFLEWRQNV